MNSEAVSALIAKSPSLKTAKPKLEAMEPGAYVVHRSWGFGQIKSYDDAAQRLMHGRSSLGERAELGFRV